MADATVVVLEDAMADATVVVQSTPVQAIPVREEVNVPTKGKLP